MRRRNRLPRLPDRAETDRWVATMPVLAGIVRTGQPRCILHGDSGEVERETEWGVLYRCGDHYTLCEAPDA